MGLSLALAKNGSTRVPSIVEPLGDVGGREAVFMGAILGETGPEVPEILMGRGPPAWSLLI